MHVFLLVSIWKENCWILSCIYILYSGFVDNVKVFSKAVVSLLYASSHWKILVASLPLPIFGTVYFVVAFRFSSSCGGEVVSDWFFVCLFLINLSLWNDFGFIGKAQRWF